ncbi:uncharacterized protein LOC111883203 [Lactuca sativa]|uniref:uncharacterized protein LOC111883203 n=1 Tax=Lactuca sativa TaxID=4236 RepID=UPI000CBD5DFC|nr:uncharacterized protein LOC111883203 [Lactuca sativa]
MGCCLTTTAATAAAAAAHDSKTSSKRRDAPPSLPFEEETVKEVLSEIPVASKKPSPLISSSPTKITADYQQIPHPEHDFKSKNAVVQLTKNPIEENASEISSEMYTYSASFSAATTTTTIGTGTIDEDGEVTQKVKKLPPAKMVSRRQPTNYSGERATRKERAIRPPARRSAVPSTDKKPHFPSRNVTTAQRHGNVVPSSVIRREPPARRSRSPALRGEAGKLTKVRERSPVQKSGNRVPVTMTENNGNVKLKKIKGGGDGGGVPEPEEPGTCESLENPRVSLECFIFL